MVARPCRETTTLSGPGKKPLLEQVRFDHILEGRGIITHGRGNRLQTHRSTTIGLDDRLEILAVEFIQSLAVDTFEGQRLLDHVGRDVAAGTDLREVPDPTE